MDCEVRAVDDVIRKDFERMPSHLFHDKYRDMLTKYVASLSNQKSNTAVSWISSVRSFFANEAMSIKLQRGTVPAVEMAIGEHRFTLNGLQRMWFIADTEGKARLSVAVSLGWGIGDFLALTTHFINEQLKHVDEDGFVSFDFRRSKTRARNRGILTPTAVTDLKNYLKKVPNTQEYLWTTRTTVGVNYWLRRLCDEAGIAENGTVRFHLIRKYVYALVSSRCGVYEAKLLVGKKIPLADATYLHGLQDRLLTRYKQFAYPFLRLTEVNDEIRGQEELEKRFTEELAAKSRELHELLSGVIAENLVLKKQLQRLTRQSHEAHSVIRRLSEENADLSTQILEFDKMLTYMQSSQYAAKLISDNLPHIVPEIVRHLPAALELMDKESLDRRAF